MTRDAAQARVPAPEAVPGQVHVLLIEDDDGDALLVQELLLEASAPVALNRVRSITEAKPLLGAAACVLLDLGLPDAHQLQGVHWLQENVPQVAVVVLTGLADEHLGAEAVRAGAQDYLVKGQVDGSLLKRVIRYAVERRRFEEMQQQLRVAQIYARENARLERGLLPLPLLADARLTVATRYRPGGGQMLLGGDFFDLVELPDGSVHTIIGDVSGHGPDEAALGVCLRVAWRSLTLAGVRGEDLLDVLQQVLERERRQDDVFATACTVVVDPDFARASIQSAGHPAPLILPGPGEAIEEAFSGSTGPALGLQRERGWGAREVSLNSGCALLLYTDGIVEGKTGAGQERLGTGGLIRTMGRLRATGTLGKELLYATMAEAERLNGGPLTDDVALLLLSRGAPAGRLS